MTREQRDAEICKRYRGNDTTPGETLEALATRFHLSRERVRQIVLAAGLTKKDRVTPEKEDDTFLGLYTTAEVKKALKAEAAKQGKGVSVSSLSTRAIIDMLVNLGYTREQLTKKAVDRLVHA